MALPSSSSLAGRGRRPVRGDLVVRRPQGLRAPVSAPRRLSAWLASAATPIATSARSAAGSGRTTARNCSARAPIDRREDERAFGGELEHALAPVGDLLDALEQARVARAPRRAGSWPTASGRACSARSADGERRGAGDGVQRGELGEAQVERAELLREADDEVAPQGAAHRDAVRQLARVLQLVARGRHAGREQRIVHVCMIAHDGRARGHDVLATVHRRCRRAPVPPSRTRATTEQAVRYVAPRAIYPGQGSQYVGMGQALATLPRPRPLSGRGRRGAR